MIAVPIKMLGDDSPVPSYAHAGDAGIDLSSTHDATIQPFERVMIHCGFSMQLPDGYAGLVLPRSGLGSKHGVTLPNSPGLIDSGYRGEIMVPLVNLDPDHAFVVKKGDRVAQLVIVETPAVDLIAVDALDESERGAEGFGSSGIKARE